MSYVGTLPRQVIDIPLIVYYNVVKSIIPHPAIVSETPSWLTPNCLNRTNPACNGRQGSATTAHVELGRYKWSMVDMSCGQNMLYAADDRDKTGKCVGDASRKNEARVHSSHGHGKDAGSSMRLPGLSGMNVGETKHAHAQPCGCLSVVL